MEAGGLDSEGNCEEALLSCNDDEWTWIEERLRAKLTPQNPKPPRNAKAWSSSFGSIEIEDYSSKYQREAILRFIAERLRRTGRGDEARLLLRKEGSPEQRAFALVESGEIEKAIEIAEAHFAQLIGLVTRFADTLYEAGHQRAALDYISKAITTDTGNNYRNSSFLSWLAQRTKADGPLDEAIEWHRQLFLMTPSMPVWDDLLSLASQAKKGDEVRGGILGKLKKSRRFEVLFDIALHEKDLELALQLWPSVAEPEKNIRRENLAVAAEKTHPEVAIEQWTALAHKQIEARSRNAYQQAAKFLRRVRDIYKKQKELEVWDDFIASLRIEHKKLRALQDELKQADL